MSRLEEDKYIPEPEPLLFRYVINVTDDEFSVMNFREDEIIEWQEALRQRLAPDLLSFGILGLKAVHAALHDYYQDQGREEDFTRVAAQPLFAQQDANSVNPDIFIESLDGFTYATTTPEDRQKSLLLVGSSIISLAIAASEALNNDSLNKAEPVARRRYINGLRSEADYYVNFDIPIGDRHVIKEEFAFDTEPSRIGMHYQHIESHETVEVSFLVGEELGFVKYRAPQKTAYTTNAVFRCGTSFKDNGNNAIIGFNKFASVMRRLNHQ